MRVTTVGEGSSRVSYRQHVGKILENRSSKQKLVTSVVTKDMEGWKLE